jgi:hypothetical protein
VEVMNGLHSFGVKGGDELELGRWYGEREVDRGVLVGEDWVDGEDDADEHKQG